MAERILVVEDEPSLRYVLSSVLGGAGCEVTCAASAEDALALLDGDEFALAMVDIVMPGMNGLELLGILRERTPRTEVIIMTSHASLETALEAIRKGAYDYLHKPFEIDEVTAIAGRALEKHRLVERNRELLETMELQNRELAAAVKRLAALNAAGIGFSGRNSAKAVLDLFLEIVRDSLGAERVSIMMRHADEDCLRMVAALGIDEEVVRTVRVRRGEGVAGRVFESGAPWLVADTKTDSRTHDVSRADLSSSFMSVPMLLSVPIMSLEKVIGVVNVTERRSGAAFDTVDAEFLTGLCGQLAVSIERARQTDRLHDTVEMLKVAQDRLVASERLNALGVMAAGVAHDFNNILNGVLGRTQLLLASAARGDLEPATLRKSLELLETLAHQGSDAVKRIQESARANVERGPDAVDVNSIVRLGIELLRPRLESAVGASNAPIDVHCELEDVPFVTGKALELLQALSNLAFNAVEAMPHGGSLTLRTRPDGAWTRIEVADTGVGMSEDVKSRLFLPFHTTKSQGNGLGLNIVHGLVTRMGGSISVVTAPGKGSTFTILLPACGVAARTPSPCIVPRTDGPRRARVLVVDDERYNLEFYAECLALHGHEVAMASNGSEALAIFESQAPELVLTDFTMPGMNGWELAAALKDRAPGLPVIMLSGWTTEGIGEGVRKTDVDLMLTKPIDIEYLLEAIQEVLSASSLAKGR